MTALRSLEARRPFRSCAAAGCMLPFLKNACGMHSNTDCDLAMMVALAGSDSQRNAERKGFQIAYTRMKWKLFSCTVCFRMTELLTGARLGKPRAGRRTPGAACSLVILITSCAIFSAFSGTQPEDTVWPLAQPLPALAHGNILRLEDGQDRFRGVLGIHDPRAQAAAPLSQMDGGHGQLCASEAEESLSN